MESEVLRAIDGIGIFPVVSLVTFVIVFTVMLVWTARLDRRRLDELAGLPFDARPDEGRGARGDGREGAGQ